MRLAEKGTGSKACRFVVQDGFLLAGELAEEGRRATKKRAVARVAVVGPLGSRHSKHIFGCNTSGTSGGFGISKVSTRPP